ncbi:MAG: hypothetical protein KBA53_12910, partial [Thermoclostridium sp.]|nr:hypothetical protein [Thermoclostridium sp.]
GYVYIARYCRGRTDVSAFYLLSRLYGLVMTGQQYKELVRRTNSSYSIGQTSLQSKFIEKKPESRIENVFTFYFRLCGWLIWSNDARIAVNIHHS